MPKLRIPKRTKKQLITKDHIITGTGGTTSTSPKKLPTLSYKLLIPAVLLVAGIGTYLILSSKAATSCLNTTSAIQTAVAASSSSGTSICVVPGTYGALSLSGSHTSDVTLQPDPTLDPSGAGKVTFTNGFDFARDASHIAVKNFYITGTVNLKSGNSYITVDHNDISGGGYGIGLLTNNIFQDNPRNPTTYDKVIHHITINGNRIHDTSHTSEGDAIRMQGYQYVTISNNEIYNIWEDQACIVTDPVTGKKSDKCHTDCLQSFQQWYDSTNGTLNDVVGQNQAHDLIYDHNYLHDNSCQEFFLKDGNVSPNVTFTENLFLRNNSIGITGWIGYWIYERTNNMIMRNNTILDNGGSALNSSGSGETPTLAFDHNVINNINYSDNTNKAYTITNDYNVYTGEGNSQFNWVPKATHEIYGTAGIAYKCSSSCGNKTQAGDDYRLVTQPYAGHTIGVDWAPSQYTYGPVNTTTACATPSTFASQVTAATPGQTICLTTGNYGTWAGTNKAITVTAGSGQTVSMALDFGLNTKDFTLDGTAGGGTINITDAYVHGQTNNYNFQANAPHNITIKNNAFTGIIVFDYMTNTNPSDSTPENGEWPFTVNLDHNTHNDISSDGGRIRVFAHDEDDSGIIVQNSTIRDNEADGIQSYPDLRILNNEFDNIQEGAHPAYHTDSVQVFGKGGKTVISGNWFHNGSDAIAQYDGAAGMLIENNVIHSDSPGRCLELYYDHPTASGQPTIVRHNTLYGGCSIDLNHKTNPPNDRTDPPGYGTIVKDNIVPGGIDYSSASGNPPYSTAAVNTNNLIPGASPPSTNIPGTAVFSGGANPTNHDGFILASNAPAGRNAASDGTNIGVYAIGSTIGGDTTKPITTINTSASGTPSSSTTSTSATLTFTANETSTFQCKLDTAVYSACSSPKAYTGLSVGLHTFSVLATDTAGNVETTAKTYSWTITTTTTTCSTKPGNANTDSVVNIQDIATVLSNYGKTVPTGTTNCADVNNDKIINIQDIAYILGRYGT